MIRHTEYKRGSGRIHPIDAEAGQKLRDARAVANMSQEQLAEKSGITFQQIQKYERGKNRMSLSRLWQFCEILGLSPSYFFPEGGKSQDGKLIARIVQLEAAVEVIDITAKRVKKTRARAA